MRVCTVKGLSLSDIHLGSRSTDTSQVIKSLNHYFNNDELLASCDIIYLVGDFTDRPIGLYENNFSLIYDWILNTLYKLAKFKVKLRVLEGTPRHDNGQSKLFDLINNGLHHKVDLKYVSEISIEHIEDLGIDILYVPEIPRKSPEEILAEVNEVFKNSNLNSVDFGLVHLAFKYQLPMIQDKCHDQDAYLKLVKGFTFVGHIHQKSVYRNKEVNKFGAIAAQGSTDRHFHSEEGDKGIFYFEYNGGSCTNVLKFLVNPLAKKYMTANLIDVEKIQAEQKIIKMVESLAANSYIKVIYNDKTYADLIAYYKSKYTDFKWSTEYIKPLEDKVKVTSVIEDDVIVINKDNIAEILYGELIKTETEDEAREIIKSFKEIMKEA